MEVNRDELSCISLCFVSCCMLLPCIAYCCLFILHCWIELASWVELRWVVLVCVVLYVLELSWGWSSWAELSYVILCRVVLCLALLNSAGVNWAQVSSCGAVGVVVLCCGLLSCWIEPKGFDLSWVELFRLVLCCLFLNRIEGGESGWIVSCCVVLCWIRLNGVDLSCVVPCCFRCVSLCFVELLEMSWVAWSWVELCCVVVLCYLFVVCCCVLYCFVLLCWVVLFCVVLRLSKVSCVELNWIVLRCVVVCFVVWLIEHWVEANSDELSCLGLWFVPCCSFFPCIIYCCPLFCIAELIWWVGLT